jgi:hypothetical protein
MIGAAAAGTAISGGPTASAVHAALLVAGGACLVVGAPATLRLEAPATARGGPKQALRAARGEAEVATAQINLLG